MLQQPLSEGADLVMHSATKYLGGHSDVVMGCLMLNDDELDSKLRTLQNSCGGVAGPMDSFLVLRGIKTLHLRMQRHCENGRAVVDFLSSHPMVKKVYWPAPLIHHILIHEICLNTSNFILITVFRIFNWNKPVGQTFQSKVIF